MSKQWDDEDLYDMQQAREEYENKRISKEVEKRGSTPVNYTGFEDKES